MQEKGSGVLSRAVEVSVMMTVFGRFLQYAEDQLHTLSMLVITSYSIHYTKLYDAIAPASPQPFTPSGLCGHKVSIMSSLKLGKSFARGIQ